MSFAIAGRRLVDAVTMNAAPGQIVGLIGPNGAGKSTLLKTIGGILQAVGSVSFAGLDLGALDRQAIAQRVARVPQDPVLPAGYTARETVLMGRNPHLGRFQWESSADHTIVDDAMIATDTVAFADRLLADLSGGERQRVYLARALAQQPKLLLLDEPTANLDVCHQIQMLERVRGWARAGLTAIAAIHDLDLAARYCDRLVLLRHGRVLADGSPADVLTPNNLWLAYAVRAVVRHDALTGALGVTILPDDLPEPRAPGAHVHVIGGGGQTAHLLYELQRAGYRLSTGVLAEHDSDCVVAQGLGIETVSIPPYTVIDDDAFDRTAALVRAADVVVLASIPFGQGNLRNLSAAALARRLVMIAGRPPEARDFTGGAATAELRTLQARATVVDAAAAVATIGLLVDAIPTSEPLGLDHSVPVGE